MEHTTKIVRTQQMSDEALAITIRCCGNPKTDSVLTIYDVGKLSPSQLEADVDKHHDRVSQKCQAMNSGKALLVGLLSVSKTHEDLF
jgi:hypothetical protein